MKAYDIPAPGGSMECRKPMTMLTAIRAPETSAIADTTASNRRSARTVRVRRFFT